MRRVHGSILVALLLAGCGASGPTRPPTTPEPTLFVRTFDGDTCRLAGLPPMPITFRIVPDVPWPDQIVAIDASGERHAVYWAEGFTGGTLDDPVVRDPAGELVARDGDVLDRDANGEARLHGYEVCSGGGLFVLLRNRQEG